VSLLLDTHAFLWWINDDPALPAPLRIFLEDYSDPIYLSMASCWEISIKAGLGKFPGLPTDLERFLNEQLEQNDFRLLPIELRHVARVCDLPTHHRDPFDRLLIAQAMLEGLTLVSVDDAFSAYTVNLRWV
jgi:PIN domain nuclease of toxin-antitoxin system